MRRLLAMAAVAAAALALPAPTAFAQCYGTGAAGACVTRECGDPNCFMYRYTVEGYCASPLPPTVCAVHVTVP